MSVKTDPAKAKEIGRRIIQARQEAGGMTQRELGELIGVSERSIAAYEAGDVTPYRFLRKLEEVLGRSAAWILHGDDAPVTQDKQFAESLRRIEDQLALIRLKLP